MRRVIIILLCLISTLAYSQVMGRYPFAATPAIVADEYYEDDFESYTAGQDLRDQTGWGSIRGEDINIYDNSGDNVIRGRNDYYAYAYYDDTFADDQWSQITVDAINTIDYVGVIVRFNSTSEKYYLWMGNSSVSYLRAIQYGGLLAAFATGDGWSATDVIKLEVAGYELRCYKNGSLDTSIDTDGKYTVTTSSYQIPSGKAGVATYDQDGSYADDWKGGDL